MAPQLSTSREPIPGYTLVERIGSGGYGEVWKAIAPGAIEKAIKFIYGHYDEECAARELKALGRVKEVRHPFLLSLDRIEVIDGQLVIVMELADESLKDRFTQYIIGGSTGILREDLLSYLRDAADALDYMCNHCSLQHLDVKPENLLLIGRRVKVADFGLVRSVHEVTASLMGGLTPSYAPPEVFEGSPGLRSDQYSLAIVYHEMLTGRLPFSATTPAQLMKQHLYERPQIAALPRADQPTIARALSKDPDDRFPSCRAMIESLLSAPDLGPGTRAVDPDDGQARADAVRGGTLAESADLVVGCPSSEKQSSTVRCFGAESDTVAGVRTLPPIEAENVEPTFRPAAVIGLGGTGARVLRRMRRRLHQRFGDIHAMPALQTLLIDADLKTVLAATNGDVREALDPSQTLAVPLKGSADYRNDSAKYLKWLSRRWLYNIPRSLQPEGRRPLGRVALIDHAEEVRTQLGVVLRAVRDPAHIQRSAEHAGVPVGSTTPRILLVASASGGTGGGMVLDVAYMLRNAMQQLGIPEDALCLILAHSSGRSSDARDLAIANAYACLAELWHFTHPSLGYPGSPECDLPPTDNDNRFPTTYMVHLGSELSREAFDEATESIAQYLYLDVATPTGNVFNYCRARREDSPDRPNSGLKLRTFGLVQAKKHLDTLFRSVTAVVSSGVVRGWLGELTDATGQQQIDISEHAPPGIDEKPTSPDTTESGHEPGALCGMSIADMEDRLFEFLADKFRFPGETLCASLRRRTTEWSGGTETDDAEVSYGDFEEIVCAIDCIGTLELETAVPGIRDAATLETELEGRVDNEVQELQRDFHRRLEPLLQSPSAGMASACRTVEMRLKNLGHARHDISSRRGELHRELASQLKLLRPDGRGEAPTAVSTPRRDTAAGQGAISASQLERCLEIKLRGMALFGVDNAASELARSTGALQESLRNARTQLKYLQRNLESRGQARESMQKAHDEKQRSKSLQTCLRESLFLLVPSLTAEVRQRLHEKFFVNGAGAVCLLGKAENVLGTVASELEKESCDAVRRTLNQINIGQLLVRGDGADWQLDEELRTYLTAAKPLLVGDSGALRLLLVAGGSETCESFQNRLTQITEQPCSTVVDTDGDLVVCYEGEQLAIGQVASRIAEHRSDYANIATRLHTRVDVAWTPMTT